MIARLSILQYRPEHLDILRRVYNEEVIPTLKQQPGFHHLYLMADKNTAHLTQVSIWESHDDFDAYARTVQPSLIGRIKDFVLLPPVSNVGLDLLVHG